MSLASLLLLASTWQAPAAPPAMPVEPSPALRSVVVIGASLSTGFGLERKLSDVLDASLAGPHARIRNEGDLLMFTRPERSAADQVERAARAEPTLVVALDFLFWFGYGTIGPGGAPITREEDRLAMLERGLALLGELDCPLVLADFPDMSASVGRMITREQMPARETLAKLSQRVRAFAAGRPRTVVLPLSKLVHEMKAEQEVKIGRHTYPPRSRLLQPDELHPTLEGLVAVGQLVCDELVKLELAREAEFVFDRKLVHERTRGPASAR